MHRRNFKHVGNDSGSLMMKKLWGIIYSFMGESRKEYTTHWCYGK